MLFDKSSRPVRYAVPEGDYKPRPTYRRPGSDHRHIPSLREQRPTRQR